MDTGDRQQLDRVVTILRDLFGPDLVGAHLFGSARFDFQYGDWLRNEFESGTVEPWPITTNPDVASLIAMV